MSEPSEPAEAREFWIDTDTMRVRVCAIHTKEFIHVIERAAFDRMKSERNTAHDLLSVSIRENNELRAELAEARRIRYQQADHAIELMAERDAALALAEGYRKALARIAAAKVATLDWICFSEIAREALEK